jgi:hypothetical protein
MDDPIQLLQKIADNTSRNDSWWIALISGCAVILGAGITALFAYLVGMRTQQTDEKRLRAEVITRERLRWLQDIRQRLSHFYAQLDMQYTFLKRPIPMGETIEYQRALNEFSTQIIEQCNFMTLMLNPKKPHQAILRKALHEAIGFLKECTMLKNSGSVKFDDQHYTEIKQTAFDSLVEIGLETWRKIKLLE